MMDGRAKVVLERTFDAEVEEVWELWTTGGGIESWWGPDGFEVKVRSLDLRPGGEMAYAMITVGSEHKEFMRKAGMPLTTELVLTFTEVTPLRRLAYQHLADFVPGVEPYLVRHVIDFHAGPGTTRVVLTMDAMHDAEWTQRATLGWEGELEKLAAELAARRTA